MNANGKRVKFLLLIIIVLITARYITSKNVTPSYAAEDLWGVRSVDTMKTSRDMAQAKLHDLSYDTTIDKEVNLAKDLGANYIAIDTPYDSEFLPYLERWVSAARRVGLNVWFRGTFSGYEGWFGYKKSINPDDLLSKTQAFIASNKDLFEDKDIFDPCPECENAGFWKQPQGDDSYNQFVQKKQSVLKDSFEKINKKVIYNWNSVIGGRAKDVLKEETFSDLGHVVAIDHYATPVSNYSDYIHYFFDNFKTNVVFSEVGAPIPDIHGRMTEQAQADFMRGVLTELYKNKDHVLGVNYWVLSGGTTALYNSNYTPRKVVEVIKDFYNPAVIRGTVKNSLGDSLSGIKVSTGDGNNSVLTDSKGNYSLVVPPGTISFTLADNNYVGQSLTVNLARSEHSQQDFTLIPQNKSFLYDLREHMNEQMSKLRERFGL